MRFNGFKTAELWDNIAFKFILAISSESPLITVYVGTFQDLNLASVFIRQIECITRMLNSTRDMWSSVNAAATT